VELLSVLARAVSAYLVLLLLVRVSGKRTVLQASAFDLLVTLIVGDSVDDFIFAEVRTAQFVAAVLPILGLHVLLGWLRVAGLRPASFTGSS
jgi:uncharacterized membrane protein YcaP (DUF421 family)